MNSFLIALISFISFYLGFRYYSPLLFRKLGLDKETKPTPAHEFQDNIDYLPTKKSVLFGHHFSSIAGASPIVGPAVAIIWGWLPALIWIVVGAIFLGAAHDFGTLAVSMKNGGKSLGEIASKVLGTKIKISFLLCVFILVCMVLAVFSLIISHLFISFPASVLPVNFEIVIAIIIGWWSFKQKKSLLIPSILAQGLLLVAIYVGLQFPLGLSEMMGQSVLSSWIIILLLYCLVASVLPVWFLMQPRDFINSHQLFVGLILLILGLMITQPPLTAPMINFSVSVTTPDWFPFLFVTIACGAISGFHGLVSSGTTSKQIANWKDARAIGYGSMLGEAVLAIIATLAVATAFESESQWLNHFHDWNKLNSGLSSQIEGFVIGASRFLSGLGIPKDYSANIIAVLIISFAATSLDTAARIQRYLVGELGEEFKIKILSNRFVSSLVVLFSTLLLVFSREGGKGGLVLWPLFGSSNQMLAGLSLLLISLYLKKESKKTTYQYLVPAVIVIILTTISLLTNIYQFYQNKVWLLTILASVMLLLQTTIIIQSIRKWKD